MSDFAGTEYDFAAGSIKGLRGWNMDELGRLHGVTHREVWTPGENVSVCKQTREVPCPGPKPQDRLPKLSEAAVDKPARKKRRRGHSPSEPLAPWERELLLGIRSGVNGRCGDNDPTCYAGKHTVPSGHRFDPECQCGFWAYDEAGFKAHGTVVGVIEGFGKVTVGTKGFRAEKARIVALSCADGEGKRHSRSVLARLTTLYPDAAFANTLDELIDEHSEVLRSWPEVDEGFWTQPVREQESAWNLGGTTMVAANARLMGQTYALPSYLRGGI